MTVGHVAVVPTVERMRQGRLPRGIELSDPLVHEKHLVRRETSDEEVAV